MAVALHERVSGEQPSPSQRLRSAYQEFHHNMQEGSQVPYEKWKVVFARQQSVHENPISGKTVEYIASGSGTTAVLNFGGSFESLMHRAPYLDAFGTEGLMCIAPRYTTFFDHTNYSYSAVEAVLQGTKALLEELGIEKVVIKGTSLGGLLAGEFYEYLQKEKEAGNSTIEVIGARFSHTDTKDSNIFRHPQYASLDVLCKADGISRAQWQKLYEYMYIQSRKRREEVNIEELTKENREYFLYASYVTEQYYKNELTYEEAQGYNRLLSEMTRHVRRPENLFRRIIRTTKQAATSMLHVPTVILHSHKDNVMKAKQNLLAAKYPYAKVSYVSENGHLGSFTGLDGILREDALLLEEIGCA